MTHPPVKERIPDLETALLCITEVCKRHPYHIEERMWRADVQESLSKLSSAPNLLAVLKKCLKDELARRAKLLNKSTAACYADSRIEQMKAAIAKAEGR